MTRWRTGCAALAALALAAAARAGADPSPLVARVSVERGRVLASVDLSAAFGPSLEREVGNGLTNVVAVYVAILPAGRRSPVLLHGRVFEILYDVWEETYAVTRKDPHVPQGIRVVLADFAALRAFLSDERSLDLGPASLLPAEPFVVEARVELNPLSKEQLQRTREFIANPAAGTRTSGGSRSVLGAVASFLLREPEPGSDVHLFRSPPLQPGEIVPR